jgi:diguanylate cyclase (GGDEF)-like protein/PAS domain S-box-containing protein
MMHAVDTEESVSAGWISTGATSHRQSIWHAIKSAIGRDVIQIAAGCFTATILSLSVMGRVDQAMLLWPVSGVALALALPNWHLGWKKRVLLMASAVAGFVTAAAAVGMPLPITGMLSVLTCLDVMTCAAILGPSVRTFEDLKQVRNILRFLAASMAAPLVTGSAGALVISGLLHLPVAQTGLMSTFADALGIGILTPAVLAIKSEAHLRIRTLREDIGRATLALLVFVAVSSYVFWQTSNPFLFMVFPPIILVLLVLGLEGAVVTSILLTIIGWIATTHGHGPVCLIRGASPLHRLVVLQGFSWIAIVTSLPVGALLDERKRADQSAKESQAIYQAMLQGADGLIVLSSLDGTSRYVSPAIERLTGWTPREYLALDRLETLHPEDLQTAQEAIAQLSAKTSELTLRYRMRLKDGSWKWVESNLRTYGVEGENVAGYVGTIRDISSLKETEERWRQERRGLVKERREMANLANTDPLTGLLNRRGFDEKLRRYSGQRRMRHTLLMIDIDFFKKYNDTYGHQAGDDCLMRVADVLRTNAARSTDVAARMGGEEFAVALLGTGLTEGMLVAEKIRNGLRSLALEHSASPFGMVTLSIGAAPWSDASDLDAKLLLAHADSALYVSKRTRDCISAFDED